MVEKFAGFHLEEKHPSEAATASRLNMLDLQLAATPGVGEQAIAATPAVAYTPPSETRPAAILRVATPGMGESPTSPGDARTANTQSQNQQQVQTTNDKLIAKGGAGGAGGTGGSTGPIDVQSGGGKETFYAAPGLGQALAASGCQEGLAFGVSALVAAIQGSEISLSSEASKTCQMGNAASIEGSLGLQALDELITQYNALPPARRVLSAYALEMLNRSLDAAQAYNEGLGIPARHHLAFGPDVEAYAAPPPPSGRDQIAQQLRAQPARKYHLECGPANKIIKVYDN